MMPMRPSFTQGTFTQGKTCYSQDGGDISVK